MRSEKVELIADTARFPDLRVTTFMVEIPIYTRTHILTHRALSRNGASSRAIPLERCDFSYTPYVFPKENDRMIPGDVFDRESEEHLKFTQEWHEHRDATLARAGLAWDWENSKAVQFENVNSLYTSSGAKAHKEILSRLVEPFKLVKFIITATAWKNFFFLRCNKAAQDSIRYVATEMKRIRDENIPDHKEYHLPFISNEEYQEFGVSDSALISAGRCASVSFGTTNKDNEKALRLSKRLQKDGHWSPFEHQAILISPSSLVSWENLCGNFQNGVVQHRHLLHSGKVFA